MKLRNRLLFFKAIVWIFLPILFIALILIGCNSSSQGDNNGELLYVAIGASDAVGIGASPLTNGYVFKIRDSLEEENLNVELRNLGILGAKLDEIKVAVGLLLSGIGSGLVGNPDLITI